MDIDKSGKHTNKGTCLPLFISTKKQGISKPQRSKTQRP